jgi:hypothetical protein
MGALAFKASSYLPETFTGIEMARFEYIEEASTTVTPHTTT